ncbi:MAG TPA: TonB-dependent receptor [Candidatus Eisenbacteria bacterium]
MFPILAALLAVAPVDSAASAPVDSTRVVRHFPAIEVSAGRVHDMRSSATVHIVTADALRDLPLTSFTQALALQPGVVAAGEDLHVRGGRAGETQWTLDGITLNEPLRDRAPELPLMAVARAELLAGGLDAEYMGSLAGVLDLHTWNPSPQAGGAVRWLGTGRHGTAFDWLGARGSVPLPLAGLGLVSAGEVRLDDQFLPQRPSRGRSEILGRSFGWRNDNHLLGWAKLASIASPQVLSLEVTGSRVVTQPYDPMFTWDDSVLIHTITPPPDGQIGPPTIDSLNVFYRAADHEPMSETRRLAGVLQASRLRPRSQWHAALGWLHGTELVSPGLTHDVRDLLPSEKVRFGESFDPARDPFRAYGGDWPYFKRTRSDRVQAAVSGSLVPTADSRVGFGAGLLWDDVQLYELDSALPTRISVDSVRAFHTRAPGGWAYAQHRWEHEGLVWNGGMRLQVFSAGGDARARTAFTSGSGGPGTFVRGPGAIVTLSPRFGLAFPLSVRDAMSISYARIHQPPGREYLSDDRLLVYSRRPLGNPTLEPSELVTYQVGVKHLFDARWSLQLSLFHRDLFGQIGIVNDPYFTGTFRPRYQNSEYGHATGFEVALLAGARPGATPAAGTQSLLERFLSGEFSLRYTQMDAYGSISSPDGWYYGEPIGFRPLPIGEHPLDWDHGPMFGFDAVWREPHAFTLAWVTQIAGGARWTPTNDTLAARNSAPGTSPNLTAVNSRQLPASERTDVSLRLEPAPLHGMRLLLDVRNLFDSRGQAFVSVPGYPNPLVNAARDDYAGYRTLTGKGGGAYWDSRLNGGRGGWVPVSDARLQRPPRSVRVGLEVGL